MQQLPSPAPVAPASAPGGSGLRPGWGSWRWRKDAERLPFWQNAWRLALVWLLSMGMWFAIGTIATEGWERGGSAVAGIIFLDLAVGHLALVVVAFRRRWPLAVALVSGALCLVSTAAAVPSLLALISLATRRHLPTIVLVTVFNMAVDTFYEFVMPPILGIQSEVTIEDSVVAQGDSALLVNLGFVFLIYVICVLIGWNVGSRRELIRSWRTGAETANREQAARVAQARVAERARIAREMHDVLAHRLSLVAMHAGVLAHRTDLPEEERRQAAEIVRAGSHQALEELREVLGVLRADGEEGPALAPQPGLTAIPTLVAEVTSSGQEVHLLADEGLWPRSLSLPTSTGRHAYRVVQESLTNARKHAPGEPVTVEMVGDPRRGLSIVVSNAVAARAEESLPGAGRGLAGMAERVQLAGGRFEAGLEVTRFVVRVWLPWAEGEGVEQDGTGRDARARGGLA